MNKSSRGRDDLPVASCQELQKIVLGVLSRGSAPGRFWQFRVLFVCIVFCLRAFFIFFSRNVEIDPLASLAQPPFVIAVTAVRVAFASPPFPNGHVSQSQACTSC